MKVLFHKLKLYVLMYLFYDVDLYLSSTLNLVSRITYIRSKLFIDFSILYFDTFIFASIMLSNSQLQRGSLPVFLQSVGIIVFLILITGYYRYLVAHVVRIQDQNCNIFYINTVNLYTACQFLNYSFILCTFSEILTKSYPLYLLRCYVCLIYY